MTTNRATLISNVKHVNHQLAALRGLGMETDFHGLRLFDPKTLDKMAGLPFAQSIVSSMRPRSGSWQDDVNFHGLGFGTYTPVLQAKLGLADLRSISNIHISLQNASLRRHSRRIRKSRLVHFVEGLGGSVLGNSGSEIRLIMERRSLHPVDMRQHISVVGDFPGEVQSSSLVGASHEGEFSAADAIVVYSETARESCIRNGIPEEKVWVVPIPFQRRLPPSDRALAPESPSFIFVGASLPHKGIDVAVTAVNLMDSDAEITVIGSAGVTVQNWFTGRRVKYLGLQPTSVVEQEMLSSTAFVMPSKESFGLAILEAIALSVPCLISDASGIASELRRFAPECVVEGRDPYLWRDRMRWVASLSEVERGDLVARSQRVLEQLTFESSVHRQVSMYEAVLA